MKYTEDEVSQMSVENITRLLNEQEEKLNIIREQRDDWKQWYSDLEKVEEKYEALKKSLSNIINEVI